MEHWVSLRRVPGDCITDVKLKAYTTLVRPQLGYAWNLRGIHILNEILTKLKWSNIEQLHLYYMTILDEVMLLLWLNNSGGTLSSNVDYCRN